MKLILQAEADPPGLGRKQMGFSDSETVRQHGSSLLVNFSALTEPGQDSERADGVQHSPPPVRPQPPHGPPVQPGHGGGEARAAH